jgi:hypothetical protein
VGNRQLCLVPTSEPFVVAFASHKSLPSFVALLHLLLSVQERFITLSLLQTGQTSLMKKRSKSKNGYHSFKLD